MADTPIRCIVGLGNPGAKHEGDRHNVGFWLVDRLARRYGGSLRPETKFQGEFVKVNAEGDDCFLLKPTTFMNASGRSVSALAKFYKIDVSEMLVVHDELDMEPGVVRLKTGGGHGGHNGLRDISSALGKEFHRARVGIGHPGHKDAVAGYVLSRPNKVDQEKIEQGLDELERVISDVLKGDLQGAMRELHSRT